RRASRRSDRTGPKIRRHGVPFVHQPNRRSSRLYDPSDWLRPTRLPLAAQEEATRGVRALQAGTSQIARKTVWPRLRRANMCSMDASTILHADLDAFFASVEQRDDPGLRGRPVIVGGGVVLAASYEARACGVKTAMGGRQARRLCPEAIVVRPRMAAYTEASKALYELFDDTSPLVQGLSIDEAFLDVRHLER